MLWNIFYTLCRIIFLNLCALVYRLFDIIHNVCELNKILRREYIFRSFTLLELK
jgi:hypothetical protein